MRTQREHYYLFGHFRLEPEEGRLQRDGLLVPLTPKAFAMLLVLVRNSGKLVEKEFLMQELWPDAFVEEANLTFTISVIRKALGENARTARCIETVPKRGYRFTAAVREVHAEHHVKSLAVLPFVNLSQGEGSQYFADGMQDALIAELAQIVSLRVISGLPPCNTGAPRVRSRHSPARCSWTSSSKVQYCSKGTAHASAFD